jgi:hypothetical protein
MLVNAAEAALLPDRLFDRNQEFERCRRFK